MTHRVLLVGGSPEPSSGDTLRRAAKDCSAVIAIDRGLDALLAAGIRCDLFCGDADSVSPAGAGLVRAAESAAEPDASQVPVDVAGERLAHRFDVVRYDPHKDDTDLGLALAEVARRWPDANLRCICMSGGAPDHALAVLGRLAAYSGCVEVWEDSFVQRILKAGDCWELAGHRDERFTFIPLSVEAVVSERGMRWNLDHKRVALLSDLGVSNVIDSDGAAIMCHEGVIAAWAFKGYFAGA